MGLAILLSAKSCCRLSWERWLHPLHLLAPVLLGCCRLQLTSLSSMIVILCEGLGGHPLSGVSPVLMDLHWLVIVQLRAIFCPSVQYLSFFFEIFFWTILDSCSFPFFPQWSSLSRVGMPSYCCSSSDFLQSHHTVLLSSFPLPFSCISWRSCHFLVFLRSFGFESFPRQFSPFVAQIKNVRSDPVFFYFLFF